MDWLDRLMLGIAPGAALRRIKARHSAQTLMNFDAASRGRRTESWKAPGTSADSAAWGSRARLRNLSRDMVRNRALARRGRDVITGNVVGSGIMPSVRLPGGQDADRDTAEAVMDALRDHLLTPRIDAYAVNDIRSLQAQVMNAVFTDGEVLVRRRIRNPQLEPDLALPLQVQVIEVDHLDESKTANGANDVIEGIEYGPTGRAVAYHLYDRHPGDLTGSFRGRFESRRVPASEILHIRRTERPGQMRGVPWLAPVMLTLGDLSDYQEAQILKQRMAALMTFFVTASDDGQIYEGVALEQMEPGAVVGLKPGQEITSPAAPQVNEYENFMNHGIRTIAIGLGLSYEAFGDLRGVNFSSGKMGRMEMDRFIEMWQRQLIIGQFCAGVSNWLLDVWPMARARNSALPAPPLAIEWTPPKRPMIDPQKEINAALAEIDGGLTSRQRKQREMGYDPDVIARERVEDAARAGAPAPRPPAVPGAAPQSPAPDGDDDAGALPEDEEDDADGS